MDIKKPPMGIYPEKMWKTDRIFKIEKAILDRLNTEFEIPIEWLIERNKLLKEVE